MDILIMFLQRKFLCKSVPMYCYVLVINLVDLKVPFVIFHLRKCPYVAHFLLDCESKTSKNVTTYILLPLKQKPTMACIVDIFNFEFEVTSTSKLR